MDNNSFKDNQKDDEHGSEIEIREILKPYLRKYYWFVISGLLCLALSYLYLKTKTTVYEVSASVLVKDTKSTPGSQDFAALRDISGFGKIGSNGVENEMELLKSKKMMQKVVQYLNLETTVYQKGKFQNTELYGKTSPILVQVINEKPDVKYFKEPIALKISGNNIELSSEELKPLKTTFGKTISLRFANIIITRNKDYVAPKEPANEYLLKVASNSQTTDAFQSNLKVALINKDVTVIRMTLNYPQTQKAQDILNTLTRVYNNDAIEDKNSESKKTAEFIEERIRIIGNELGEVESRKERFKESNRITDLETEAKLGLQSSAEARGKLLEIDSQLEITNALLGYVNKQGTSAVLPGNVGLDNPSATSNISAYNQLVLEKNRLLENATPQNPLVIDLTKQINSMRNSVVESLAKNRSALQVAKGNYQAENQTIAGHISKIPAQEKTFREIERQQQIKENLYLLLLQKREETAVSLAVTAPKARVVDEAYVNPIPVAPKGSMVLLIGLLTGLVIPFVVIYLLRLFDDKVKDKKDLDKLSHGKTLLGEIPSLDRGQSELVMANDITPMAEAFRIVITNMNFMLPKKDKGKVAYVTSTVKGEGKTFVSVNLALTLASPKHKVIIIGADIRNPQLQRYNPSRKGLDGLTEYLYNDDEKIEDIIHISSFNKYCDVIYSGSIPPNPADLLSNGRFEILIDQLKLIYEYIIVDTAPLMLVTDTFLNADLADATLYVTRSGFTEKSLIDFANKQINSKRIRNAAFILNDVSKDNLGYGNKYGYGYGVDNRTFFQKLKDSF
ncbi:capsular exopolysaccharide family [Kaistella chaponensis]|uniref:non-specific protein-tyrosine kinase n=1 Tax=Kaistella chaponensis TaxID=713588 RepID=A0A1N7J6U2_9FLAO|nr:tyrosine-protein kinase [Kaistella chaponensis]SIS45083.1 capsular exopolysaccharide family [Kaistella chaponensis]